MRQVSRKKNVSQYTTWYEFKKDLEAQLGYVLFNAHWLEVKPKSPLPWEGSHLAVALKEAAQSRGRQRVIK